MRKGRNGPRFGEKINFGTSRDLDLSNFFIHRGVCPGGHRPITEPAGGYDPDPNHPPRRPWGTPPVKLTPRNAASGPLPPPPEPVLRRSGRYGTVWIHTVPHRPPTPPGRPQVACSWSLEWSGTKTGPLRPNGQLGTTITDPTDTHNGHRTLCETRGVGGV